MAVLGTNPCHIPTPQKMARIYTIDSLIDLEHALNRYTDHSAERFKIYYLDFEKMSQDYDAIHLTGKGQEETRYSFPGLYGWDVESTVWFRWCFDEVQETDPFNGVKLRKLSLGGPNIFTHPEIPTKDLEV